MNLACQQKEKYKMNWMNLFEPHILGRGMEYCEDGCVSDLHIIGNIVKAEVEGTECYQVSIELDGEEIMDMSCNCPYAAKGYRYNCKHMAAVLCEYESYLADEDDNKEEDYDNDSMNIAQMTNLKKEIKNIIYRYGGGSFIDWQYAYDFCSDLRNFLDDKIPLLIENQCYLQAFELTNIVFREVGNTDMDDSDGGSAMVAEKCYDYWRKITEKCNGNDRKIIKKWFQDHKNTDFVILKNQERR